MKFRIEQNRDAPVANVRFVKAAEMRFRPEECALYRAAADRL
ncbi:hypothetical protein [Rhodovulum sulfidophilum]|nr:hypothetical protein [Rhodovulum sulfidophilum]